MDVAVAAADIAAGIDAAGVAPSGIDIVGVAAAPTGVAGGSGVVVAN